jgi:DNA-binding MarR family transcriptional regulator
MDDYAHMEQPYIDECARVVLDVVPQVMQHIRTEMRSQRGPELSVLQLRALAFLRNHPGSPLSALAEHVGLTLPSMSSQVSGLVARQLIDRSTSTEDRRYITLTLTAEGVARLDSTRARAQAHLAETLGRLSKTECASIVSAMRLLAETVGDAATDQVPVSSSTKSRA